MEGLDSKWISGQLNAACRDSTAQHKSPARLGLTNMRGSVDMLSNND